MTNQEILSAAIFKAKANGWQAFGTGAFSDPASYLMETLGVSAIIFNHEFAKAIWGDKWPYEDYGKYGITYPVSIKHDYRTTSDIVCPPYWKYQLQQMVIADDPLQYLARFI